MVCKADFAIILMVFNYVYLLYMEHLYEPASSLKAAPYLLAHIDCIEIFSSYLLQKRSHLSRMNI